MASQMSDAEMGRLSEAECWGALAAHSVGRVGVIVDGFPLVVPVNYALDDRVAVIRTAPDSVLAHADGSNVTVQIDQFDLTKKSGWSVTLRGAGRALKPQDPQELWDRTRATGLSPWAPGERPLWIRITPEAVSGRRIVAGDDLEWRLASAAYL